MLIKDLYSAEGKEVTLQGWIANKRESKSLAFLIFRDGSGMCQCVISQKDVTENVWENAKKLTMESSVKISGKVVKDERQIGGHEIHVKDIFIYQVAEEYPIAKKEHGVDFLMNYRHLWLRSQRQWAIMRIRNRIIFSIHTYFQDHGFVQMDSPIFTGNAVEGTSTLFETDFYGEPAYLSQSGQLYGEAMAIAMGKIYTFGPTFRAEKSKTRRHLSEFWMIEPEMVFYDLQMNLDLIEDFIVNVVNDVLRNCGSELKFIGRNLDKLKNITKPFPRITYTEAVELLKGKKSVELLNADSQKTKDELQKLRKEEEPLKKATDVRSSEKRRDILEQIAELEERERNIPQWLESAKKFQWGGDFGGSDETVLTRHFEKPVMVHRYPAEVKAFYMKRDEKDNRLALGVDVLAPEGYGEIVGGGQREEDEKILIQRIKEHKLPMSAFEWYLDLRRYGTVPHSGFGLGLERFVSWICALPHVRETIPFPRMMGRLFP